MPETNPEPADCHVMLLIGILLVQEMRSPLARQLNVAVRLDPVRVLEVTDTGFSFAGIEGAVSGFASAKLKAGIPKVNFALAETVGLRVKVRD